MLTYYTDGSASPNPGPGGYAVVQDGKPVALGSEDGDTTNIRMEGFALIAALTHANGKECQIHTDSEFWINVITKWSLAWEANGWKKKGGPIKISTSYKRSVRSTAPQKPNLSGCVATTVMKVMRWPMYGQIKPEKARGSNDFNIKE